MFTSLVSFFFLSLCFMSTYALKKGVIFNELTGSEGSIATGSSLNLYLILRYILAVLQGLHGSDLITEECWDFD